MSALDVDVLEVDQDTKEMLRTLVCLNSSLCYTLNALQVSDMRSLLLHVIVDVVFIYLFYFKTEQ